MTSAQKKVLRAAMANLIYVFQAEHDWGMSKSDWRFHLENLEAARDEFPELFRGLPKIKHSQMELYNA